MTALRAIPAALLCLALAVPAHAGESLPLNIGGDFVLVDHNGASRRSAEFRGRHMLVYFGYTACPFTCGIALGTISAALDDLGGDAGRLAPLFITVDPKFDTPERMARHLANFHPAIIGLTGAAAEIARVRAAWRIAANPVDDPGAFARLVDHTPMIYLFGPAGELLTLLPPIVPPERMAEIIRGYLG